MTITQYEKATVILEKIKKLNSFIEEAEQHNGFFIRPYNTERTCEYPINKENKDIIMKPLRDLRSERAHV